MSIKQVSIKRDIFTLSGKLEVVHCIEQVGPVSGEIRADAYYDPVHLWQGSNFSATLVKRREQCTN
jgi:hypothetical protein